jgi:hypothetical protein
LFDTADDFAGYNPIFAQSGPHFHVGFRREASSPITACCLIVVAGRD